MPYAYCMPLFPATAWPEAVIYMTAFHIGHRLRTTLPLTTNPYSSLIIWIGNKFKQPMLFFSGFLEPKIGQFRSTENIMQRLVINYLEPLQNDKIDVGLRLTSKNSLRSSFLSHMVWNLLTASSGDIPVSLPNPSRSALTCSIEVYL